MSTDTDRIKQLHEQASEHYLNGDYHGALQAWRDVLDLDPSNEEALGGMRLAEQFVPPDVEPVAAAAPALEDDLDLGLKVLDGTAHPAVVPHEIMDGSVDLQPDLLNEESSVAEEVPEGWDVPEATPAAEESFGLEPLSASSPSPAAPASAAAGELKRRVADLLNEAKAKADAGERDEALAILARLGILDEDNPEAEALRLKVEAAGASDLDKIEQAIIEGVAALEANQLDDAERYFREALALSPEHREAKHYLEKVEQRRGTGGDDLLGGLEGESAPAEDAVQRATAPEPASVKPVPMPKAPRAPAAALPELPDAPVAASGRRIALPPPKVLMMGAVGVLVLIGAAMTLPRLFGGSTPKFTPPNPAAVAPRAVRAPAKPVAKPVPPTRVIPTDPAELAKAIAAGLATGQARMDANDPAAAIIAFNDVLAMDPANATAKAGISTAGEQYKATKAERDTLNTIKLAFRDGEFSSALRLAYRLPPTVSKSYSDGVKVAGWYNLAIVALRAGDCREAMTHLDEALDVDGSDAEVKALREFASRYADAVKDRAFLDRVEALSFRPVPAS